MRNRLKVLRAEKKLTQGQLAELAGISRTALAMIENEKSVPDGATIAALVKALETPATSIFLDLCSQSKEGAKEDQMNNKIWRNSTHIYATVADHEVRERIAKIRACMNELEAEMSLFNTQAPLLCSCPAPSHDCITLGGIIICGILNLTSEEREFAEDFLMSVYARKRGKAIEPSEVNELKRKMRGFFNEG